MDFSLTEEQQALAALAERILADHCAPPRLKAVEQRDGRYDRELWAAFAAAGLLGAALPERFGGSGGGPVDICLLLERQGRRVAPLPLLAAIVSGAMPLARFGSAEQQQRYLPGVIAGEHLLSAALAEARAEPLDPAARATPDGGAWRLDGVKAAVPVARQSAAVLVPARAVDGRIGIFIVDPRSPGVSLSEQVTGNWESQFRLEMSGVRLNGDAVLGSLDRGSDILRWMMDRTTVGVCALAAGVCQAAMQMTAAYASTRKQFDKPIAAFQAVGQRLADAYIDNEAISLTMWQAATRLAEDMPADKEIAAAKYWAAEGGSRTAHTALHIHGGMSIDTDYPIHRYFLWAKQLEQVLGAATPQLARLGAMIAGEP